MTRETRDMAAEPGDDFRCQRGFQRVPAAFDRPRQRTTSALMM